MVRLPLPREHRRGSGPGVALSDLWRLCDRPAGRLHPLGLQCSATEGARSCRRDDRDRHPRRRRSPCRAVVAGGRIGWRSPFHSRRRGAGSHRGQVRSPPAALVRLGAFTGRRPVSRGVSRNGAAVRAFLACGSVGCRSGNHNGPLCRENARRPHRLRAVRFGLGHDHIDRFRHTSRPRRQLER